MQKDIEEFQKDSSKKLIIKSMVDARKKKNREYISLDGRIYEPGTFLLHRHNL